MEGYRSPPRYCKRGGQAETLSLSSGLPLAAAAGHRGSADQLRSFLLRPARGRPASGGSGCPSRCRCEQPDQPRFTPRDFARDDLGFGCHAVGLPSNVHGFEPSVRDALVERGQLLRDADGVWRPQTHGLSESKDGFARIEGRDDGSHTETLERTASGQAG